MNTTGRAKGPGPHRTHVRETQKRGVVRQARKGFTVRCFWVAARDWRCRVHRQTKGGFVRSGPRIPAKVRPVSFGHFGRTCSNLSARSSGHCLPRPPHHAGQRQVGSHEAAPSPSPSNAMRYGKGLGQIHKLAPAGGQGIRPAPPAPAARLQRDDGGPQAQQVQVAVGDDGARHARQPHLLRRRVEGGAGGCCNGGRRRAARPAAAAPAAPHAAPRAAPSGGAPAGGPASAPRACRTRRGRWRGSRTRCQTWWPGR